jgi:hypothetical protein
VVLRGRALSYTGGRIAFTEARETPKSEEIKETKQTWGAKVTGRRETAPIVR